MLLDLLLNKYFCTEQMKLLFLLSLVVTTTVQKWQVYLTL